MSVYNTATGAGPFPTDYICPRCGTKANASSHAHTLVDENGIPINTSEGRPAYVWLPMGYLCPSCNLIFCHICKGDDDKKIVRVKGLSPSMATLLEGKVMVR